MPFSERGQAPVILSGQSNIAGLKPEESFTPTGEKESGEGEAVVRIRRGGGQPILGCFKEWKPADGKMPECNGNLQDMLVTKADAAGRHTND